MLALGNKIIAGSFKAGASWEVGDVGISAFGIDEALNKRRYLNGQVISQAQFVEFTAMLKSRVSVYPNLATTEVNWQATVTNSDLGQCGKFVIDDDAGTIRLPKVVNINGLQDLTALGGIKAESLPNITGEMYSGGIITTYDVSGVFDGSSNGSGSGGTHNRTINAQTQHTVFNASNSSSTYQYNAPVQQEAVQYPYFIQVATGVETSIDVSREIELNNPFSLLDYKYSEYELSNASWLLSNGQWNSGAVYQSVYNLLLQIYNGTVTKAGVSVKLSTETYADTDFVLNTSDTTFRLPLYTQRVLVDKKVPTSTDPTWYNLYSDGWCEQGITFIYDNVTWTFPVQMADTNYSITALTKVGSGEVRAASVREDLKTTTSCVVYFSHSNYAGYIEVRGMSASEATSVSDYTEIKGLYFYVGETVQDANIIAAAGVLNDMTNIKNASNFSSLGKETIVAWGMPDYSARTETTVGASYSSSVKTTVDSIITPWYLNNKYLYIADDVNGANEVQIGSATTGSNGNNYLVPKNKYIRVNTGSNSLYITPMKGAL